MMLVREAMNRNVILLHPDMTLREASEIFAREGISGAPVVDDEGKLVGILTAKDILRAIKSRMENVGIYVFPTPFDFIDIVPVEPAQSDVFKEISRMRVGDVMERRVHHVHEDEDIYFALELLVKNKVSRLPVVDKEGRVVGILTRSDLLRALAKT